MFLNGRKFKSEFWLQDKVYQEMVQHLDNREPVLADRSHLIRLEAAIVEVQRVRSVVPIGIPHGTTDVSYSIKKAANP